MADVVMSEDLNGQSTKQVHGQQKSANKTVIISCRKPVHSYIHLRHISKAQHSQALDEMTVSIQLDSALSQYLGFHGNAIPIDFMKLEAEDIWIRIPNDSRQAFVAALSSWTGHSGNAYRVMGWSSWDANAHNHSAGQDLFTD